MTRIFYLALAALALPVPAAAEDGCEPEFLLGADSIQVPNIVVGDAKSVVETQNIQVRNAEAEDESEGERCSATLRFARFGTSVNGPQAPFSIFAGGRALRILPDENFPGSPASDYPIPSLGSSMNGISVPYDLAIPSGWGIQAGPRVEELVALLVDATGEVVDTLPITIILNYAPSVELRFVGATGAEGARSVDLGILDPDIVNESPPFAIRVFSSAPYLITITSENRGHLVHTDRQAMIDYRLLMDGRIVNPNGGPAANVPNATRSLGDFYPMRIEVDPFVAKAGDYADRIEITVTAN